MIARLVLCLLLFASLAQAADNYIRDGASGVTCADWGANACDALPATLNRGDTYYIADGAYSTYTFNDVVSGTTHITIKKATVAAHGTSTGWVDTYGDGVATWGAISFTTSYWTFDGVSGGGPGAWTSGHGFEFSAAVAAGLPPFVTISSGVGNITVSHSYFHHVGDSTSINDPNGDAFYNPGTLNDSTFSYNYFENLIMLPWRLRTGSGNLFQYNYSGNICGAWVIYGQHCEAIVIWNMDDSTFRWNYIGESPSSGGFVRNDDGIGASADNIKIYGNIMRNGVQIQCNGICTGWVIANNTFLESTGGPVSGSGSYAGTTTYINSVTYGSTNRVQAFFAGTSHSYNWFSDLGGTPNTACTMNNVSTENITTGKDGCNTVTETIDPFVDSSGDQPEDFALSGHISGWPGTDPCTALTCTADDQYGVDMLGNTRCADGVCDRGALQYVADSDPPTPGGGGTITPSAVTSSTMTLTWTKASDAAPQASLQYQVYRSASNNITTCADALSNGTIIQSWIADIGTFSPSGLTPSTTYYFNVAVRDPSLNCAPYTTVSQATAAGSPATGGVGRGGLRH